MRLKLMLLLIAAFLCVQSCKKTENHSTSNLSSGLNATEAKSFFENNVLPKSRLTLKAQEEKSLINTVEKLANTNDLLLKKLDWKSGFYRISKNDTSIVVPIDFEYKSYYRVNEKYKVSFDKLNYAEFRKKQNGELSFDWITYYPDIEWLRGDRTKFIGRITVADWDGNIKKIYLHKKNGTIQRFNGGNAPLTEVKTTLFSKSENSSLKGLILPLGNIKIQSYSGGQAKLMSGREYMDIDGNCWRNIREIPAAEGIGVTLVRESIACPTPETPTEEPEGTETGSGETGEGGNNGSGGGGSGQLGCNPEEGYTIPLNPPPAGTDWLPPCEEIDAIEEPDDEPGGVESEAVLDTDCESFVFKKTSTANWQEGGLNAIILRLVVVNGNRSHIRTVRIDHVVYGLPTYYTNSNGSTTPLSAGQAANKAAEATEKARNDTYTEFRDYPTWPVDEAVRMFFKRKLQEYMAEERGTAGATGSGSDKIVFRDEIRAHWTDPNDC